MTVKTLSIQDLKRRLSAAISEVESGDDLVVTRHGRPVVRITRADAQHVHVGARNGRGNLVPLLRGPTRGRYLEVLREDRAER